MPSSRPCWRAPSPTSVRGAKEFADEARTILELGEHYPGDAGVLAALLLNRVGLTPGEGIFRPPATCTAICTAWAWR